MIFIDTFINKISKEKFSSTNLLWNRLGLNKAWSVGYTSSLIKRKKFKDKDEWYSYYFQSGEERLNKIKNLNQKDKSLITNQSPSFNKDLNKLNTNYGRTKIEIAKKGSLLYKEILKEGNPYDLTEDDCKYIAFFRVVCETWNGVICRERATKQTIINQFLENGYEIDIINTNGSFDYKYGVDFELYYDGSIICGIQIKPISYKSNKNYLEEAKKINKDKNDRYLQTFNRKVHYIYSNQEGNISNKEIIETIIKELELFEKTF